MITKRIPVVTVDGPSGVGKGTLCYALAKHLDWHLLDSGAIYRVLALSARNNQIKLDDEKGLVTLAHQLPLSFDTTKQSVIVRLGDEDVSTQIRTEEVGGAASCIAAIESVRHALLKRQRDFLTMPGLIADGRDMGTIVFPESPTKIFLDASAESRAERRMKQLQQKKNHAKFDQILQEIMVRDERDRTRKVAPLIPAVDALIIDTTSLSINDVFNQAMAYVTQKLAMIAK